MKFNKTDFSGFVNKEYGSLVIILDFQNENFIFGKYQYENSYPLNIERCYRGFFDDRN